MNIHQHQCTLHEVAIDLPCGHDLDSNQFQRLYKSQFWKANIGTCDVESGM